MKVDPNARVVFHTEGGMLKAYFASARKPEVRIFLGSILEGSLAYDNERKTAFMALMCELANEFSEQAR